jgi:hypothetical protein
MQFNPNKSYKLGMAKIFISADISDKIRHGYGADNLMDIHG